MLRLNLGWICLLVARSALAQAPLDVAVVSAAERDAFSVRLLSELQAAGLRAKTLPWHAGSLEEAARAQGAASATRPLASGLGLEVWMDERATGRPMLRHLVVDESPEGPNVAMVVLQTTELLRAGLHGIARAEAAAPMAPSETGRRIAGGALGVAMPTSGGFSAAAVGRVELAYLRPSGWGLELLLQWPWQAASLTTIEGRSEANVYLAAVGLRWEGARGRYFYEAAGGLMGQRWRIQGVPLGPALQGSDSSRFTMGGYGRLRLGVVLASWIRMGIEGFSLLSASRTDVLHAGRVVGNTGRFGVAALWAFEVLSP